MILGTHNTMTYLRPKSLLLKPFAAFAQCQDKTIDQQIEIGVQYFDLRIRFDDGKPYFCHGLIRYDDLGTYTVYDVLRKINELGKTKDVYVRMMLETSEYDQDQDYAFNTFTLRWKTKYPHINWWCERKYSLNVHAHDFGVNFVEKATWIKNVWMMLRTPRHYAREVNDRLLISAKEQYDDTIVAVDFIDERFAKFA